MKKKPIFFLILIIAICMAYVAAYGIKTSTFHLKGAKDMRFGIDIRGGVEAAFQPVLQPGDPKPTQQQLDSARTVIETRLDAKNIMDREVTVDAQNGYIIVRFPWKADEKDFNAEAAIAELGQTAKLTFQDSKGNVIVDGSHVVNAKPGKNQIGGDVVELTFDAEGTKLFSDGTKKLVGQPISIFMDNQNIQTATVKEQITTGNAQIDGMESYKVAKDLSDKINSGALPFSMITKNYSIISATMGKGALAVMLTAGIIAFITICALLIFYYRIPGLCASIGLIIHISGQILALSIPQMSLTLVGIAGIILSIGMGVDANIISAERINEEIKSGKSISSAIHAGFMHSFWPVFDGNITVLIVSLVLMKFGSGALLSFAYTLFTGIIFNFIAAISASRLMVLSLSSYKSLQKPKLFSCFTRRVTL